MIQDIYLEKDYFVYLFLLSPLHNYEISQKEINRQAMESLKVTLIIFLKLTIFFHLLFKLYFSLISFLFDNYFHIQAASFSIYQKYDLKKYVDLLKNELLLSFVALIKHFIFFCLFSFYSFCYFFRLPLFRKIALILTITKQLLNV